MHKATQSAQVHPTFERLEFRFERRAWNREHQLLASLNQQFQDLIALEPGLRGLMRQVRMVEHLNADGPDSDTGALCRSALRTWKDLDIFYRGEWSAIEKSISATLPVFGTSLMDRYRAQCFSLPEYADEIKSAHGNLCKLTGTLTSLGYSWCAFGTVRERAYG